MSEWQGVINTTAKQYLSGAIDSTIRNRKIFKLLQDRGRIVLNVNGFDTTWDVQFKLPPISTYGDAQLLNFTRHDLWRQLNLAWSGYVGTDAMTYKEYRMNSGLAAIIRRYDKMIPNLVKGMLQTANGEVYVDGTLAANTQRWMGLKSFMGDDGATTAADKVANPSGTYAGHSYGLASEGGTWTSALPGGTPPNHVLANDWPNGSGSPEYDFMSPLLVNWSSTSWNTNSTLWADNAERVLQQTTNWLRNKGGPDGTPDIFNLAVDLFNDYQNLQAAKFRVIVPHSEGQDLGYGDTLNQNGVMIDSDFDCPAGEGYALNVDFMELMCIQDKLFEVDGPDWDPRQQEYLTAVKHFGNLRFHPKHFARLKSYA